MAPGGGTRQWIDGAYAATVAATDPSRASNELVVVVGTGPAGVTTAIGLARRGVRVLLVESGAERETADDRALNDGDAPSGVWGHEPLGEHRRRMLGGASTAWGGRCIPLEPIDFEVRDWVPHSGWPIDYAEFRRWLPEACDLLRIPETDFRRQSRAALFHSDGTIDGAPIEVWSPPVVFSDVLHDAQREFAHLEVSSRTHVLRLRTDSAGRVVGLEAIKDGGPVLIEGARFVLAAGTLENTRLLLDSWFAPALPALGRFYQSHTFATDFAVTGPPLPPDADFFRIGSAYARRRWQLTPEAQRERGVGNVIGFVARPPVGAGEPPR